MQQQTVQPDTIIVGMDVHKYQHQAVALSWTGKILGDCQFTNETLSDCGAWLSSLGPTDRIIVGLEDVSGNGFRLNQFLAGGTYRVRYVPPILTARERAHSFHGEKTDREDALRVGKVILHNAEETLPAPGIVTDEHRRVRMLDHLLSERTDLTAHQTAVKNQLHGLLHEYYGDTYKQSFSSIFTQGSLAWYKKDLGEKGENDLLAEDILRNIQLLEVYQTHITQVTKRIEKLSKNISQVKKLRVIRGCGPLTASQILVEIGDISRFKTESKLARYAGIAPVAWQSAGKGHLHTDSRGNRKLNYAIHRLALSQLGNTGLAEAKAFHARKQEEKHSKLWSMRCLKRHLIRKVFTVLTA